MIEMYELSPQLSDIEGVNFCLECSWETHSKYSQPRCQRSFTNCRSNTGCLLWHRTNLERGEEYLISLYLTFFCCNLSQMTFQVSSEILESLFFFELNEGRLSKYSERNPSVGYFPNAIQARFWWPANVFITVGNLRTQHCSHFMFILSCHQSSLY